MKCFLEAAIGGALAVVGFGALAFIIVAIIRLCCWVHDRWGKAPLITAYFILLWAAFTFVVWMERCH